MGELSRKVGTKEIVGCAEMCRVLGPEPLQQTGGPS